MAVKLEFINLLVPIKTIEQKYPGGWQQCLKDNKELIGHSVWFDEHLLRCGAMNGMDIYLMLDDWKRLGFKTHLGGKRPTKWIDVCVVEAMFADEGVPCSWLVVEDNTAYLKGTAKGEVIDHSNISVW